MKKITYSDDACAIILMHHTIKNLNRLLSSEIARVYGSNADYSRAFKEIGRGFSDNETYKKYLTQAHNDSKSLYTRLQPLTLFEYNAYLTHILMFLQENETCNLTDAIYNAKEMLKFYPPRFYSNYASARTISSDDLKRGLKYMKQIVCEAYNLTPDELIISGAYQVLNDRINLECNREILRESKKKARALENSQSKATVVFGGTELISPFSLDNLTTAEVVKSEKPQKQKGEEEA